MRKTKVCISASKSALHKVVGISSRIKSPAGLQNYPTPSRAGLNGHVLHVAPLAGNTAAEITEKVKELIRLAQDQGHLTYGDINDALPDQLISPEIMDEVLIKLRNLEIQIVDPAEVDRIRQPEPEEEDEKTRLDGLDDPVRMYLKQMGQVPLLTRAQGSQSPSASRTQSPKFAGSFMVWVSPPKSTSPWPTNSPANHRANASIASSWTRKPSVARRISAGCTG